MDVLKQHGEKLFFVLLLVGLGFSVVTILKLRGNFKPASDVQIRTANVSLDTQNLEGVLAVLTRDKPQLSTSTDSFTSGIRKTCMNPDYQATLIPYEAKICPFCDFPQDRVETDEDEDGISDNLENHWGMDLNDPLDVYEDPDGDGFITIVEVLDADGNGIVTLDEKDAGTDPMLSSSHPPLIDYLRLEDVQQKSIFVELLGFNQLTDTLYSLQLRWRYPGESRWTRGFIKTGTRFGRNNEFEAVGYTEKRTQQDNGSWRDESFALIKVGQYELKLGRYAPASQGKITESLANLKLIAGPQWSEEVRVGSAFELDKISYKVIDIQKDSVVIKSDDSETTLTIRGATQEELDRLNPQKPDPETNPDGMPSSDFFTPQF